MGLGKSNQTLTPKLHSLSVTQSLQGIALPIIYGTNRVQQSLVWYGDFTSKQAYQQGGKGLGKNGGSGYEYFAAVLGVLCNSFVSGIGNVWSQNGTLTLQNTTVEYTVPTGGGSYTVPNSAAFAADGGVGAPTPYSVTVDNYGSPGPVTLTGTQNIAQTKTSGTPSAGQYAHSGGTYTFPAASAGQTMLISYTFSLYTLGETEDDQIPNSYPYQITIQYQTQFVADKGVTNIATGAAFQPVSGSPGRGQYNPNGGNYLFNPADANTNVAISYEWKQSNSNVDPASTLSFELIEGTQGQAPWSYLTTNHPSQAYGYSTLALIATPKMDLGQAAQLPNYNFEVQGPFQFGAGIVDAQVSSCITDLLYNPYYGAQFQGSVHSSLTTIAADYWNSNSFFISPVLNTAEPCASIIDKWCEAGNVGTYWSEGMLKFIPYGDTTTVGNGYVFDPQTSPIVDLNDDDFIADDNEDPVQIERTPWQDAYNQVKVQFTNRANAYNPGVVTEQDDYATAQFGLRPEGQQDYSFLCTAAAAQFAANIRLKRLVYIRRTYTFKISGLRYCFLEPMDMVTLTDVALGLNKEPVRITKIEEDDNRVYSITAEEFPWGTATATLYPKQPALPPPPPPALADPGNTIVSAIFEPTARVATTVANSALQIWFALSGGANWGGCNVWISYNGDSYEPLPGTQNGPSRAGNIAAPLPAGSDPDITNTLKVMTSGQLYDVTKQQADGYATICRVGDEYLDYQNAVSTGSTDGGLTNGYDLTYLRRGIFTSPNTAHAAGEQFIRCDSQLFQYSYDPTLIGQTVYFKFTSFNLLQNMPQGLEDVPAYQYVVQGTALAANMTVDSVLDPSGTTADVRIYQQGQPVGTAGSATLAGGGTIVLPAAQFSGQPLNTTIYVNYDPVGLQYVLYTDQNQWQVDEQINGYIKIGSTLTISQWVYIPLQGGGTLALGAASGAYGSSIPFPSGYDSSRALIWVSPQSGYDRNQQIKGVASAVYVGGQLQSNFQQRNGQLIPASSYWTAAAWTAGAAVSVTTSGGFTQVVCTTANGDQLCFTVGYLSSGSTVPVPSGFSYTNWVGVAAPAGVVNTGNGLQYVQDCTLTGTLSLSLIYNDNDGNTWGGYANVFGCFWQSGGGVVSESVINGTSIIIPLAVGEVGLTAGSAGSSGSVGVPSGFDASTLRAACSMVGNITTMADSVSHGWFLTEAAGTVTGTYEDGPGRLWYGRVGLFGIVSN